MGEGEGPKERGGGVAAAVYFLFFCSLTLRFYKIGFTFLYRLCEYTVACNFVGHFN